MQSTPTNVPVHNAAYIQIAQHKSSPTRFLGLNREASVGSLNADADHVQQAAGKTQAKGGGLIQVFEDLHKELVKESRSSVWVCMLERFDRGTGTSTYLPSSWSWQL